MAIPTAKFYNDGSGPCTSPEDSANLANPTELSAYDVIRQNLPDTIPSALKSKPFYEIATYTNERGENTGLDALRQAWLTAHNNIENNPLFASADGEKLRRILIDLASLSSGSGLVGNQIESFMTGFDKYGKSMLMPNIEMPGLTFFTRPRLCLQSSNLRNNPVMAPLDTANPESMAFAIRALLDTNLANLDGKNCAKFTNAIENSPLLNPECPWFIPLTNSLVSISGFPDFNLEIETTEGGYHAEQQKYAIGADNFNRGTALNLTFREMPGGVISAIFFYWLEYIRCVTRGDMLAYPDDIDGQILNYTISIYSFNMDPSMQYITRWVKCTGCFPKSLTLGAFMNKSSGNYTQEEVKQITINFEVNKVEYMKPYCLLDFNTLAKRYCPVIDTLPDGKVFLDQQGTGVPPSGLNRVTIPDSPFANFCGLPFIVSDQNGYRLVYRESNKGLFADPLIRSLIACDIARNEVEWSFDGNSSYSLYQQYDYADFYKKDVLPIKAAAANGYSPVTNFDRLITEIQNGTFLDNVSKFTQANQ